VDKGLIINKFTRKDFPEDILQFLNYELPSPSISVDNQSIENFLRKNMQFKTIYKQSPIGIEIYDSAGSLLDANQACLDIFGVKTVSEVRGFKLFEDPNLLQEMKTRIKNGETVNFETSFDFEKVKARNLYNTSLSGCIDLDVHISPIFSQELFTLIGYVVHVQDITDRKKRQLELAREKELSETLMNEMPCIAMLLKPGTREIVASNKHAVEVGAIPGKNCYETWGQRQDPCPWCLAPKAWKTGKEQHVEVEALNIIWDFHWIPINDDLYLHFAFDITERRKIEEKLKESEDKYRSLVEQANDGIVIVQGNKMVLINPQFAKMLGYTIEELLNTSYERIIHPDVINEIKERSQDRLAGNPVPSLYESKLLKKNGKPLSVELNVGLIDFHGKISFLSFIRDITDRKRTEEAIKYHIKFEHLISEISSQFINLNPGQIDSQINLAVKQIAIFTQSDSGYVFRFDNKGANFSMTHLWTSGRLKTDKANLQGLDSNSMPWWMNQLRSGQIVAVSSIRNLPQAANIEKKILQAQNNNSIIDVPMIFEKKVIGFLGMSSLREGRIWTDEEKNLLQLVGLIFSNALQRKKTEKIRKKADDVLRQRTHDLNERVKELKCLYGVSFLLNHSQNSFDEIVYEILKLIPPGWQYPEITCGRITFEGKEYTTDIFHETPWMQSADFEISGKKSGSVEVYYLEEMPEEADGPFLKEEQELIEAICRGLTDFIERKYSEKALQESEHNLKEAQTIAQVGHWRLDPETKEVTGSDELFRIFGLNQTEGTLDKFLEVVHPDDREFGLFHIRRGMEHGIPWDIEHRLLCKDGSLKYVHIKGEASINKAGIVVHLMGTVQDITDRKKTENIKRDLEQRRENFVWMTSHELRTPLTVISGYTDFLLKNINQVDPDQQNKILVTIKRNINRLMNLTEQVAQLAQFNHGTFETKKVEFNFCIFINEAIKPYKTILGNQIDFEGCSINTPVIIEGDKERLLQVLDNLLDNSVKHTHPKQREIKVNLEVLFQSIRIKIVDNGAGIAQENLKRIFEQFVSIKTEYSVTGTGIGLYLSQKIMEAHNGTIIAQSEGIGRGATFTIELPRKLKWSF
jgi:PAS domain S-box-containing protein